MQLLLHFQFSFFFFRSFALSLSLSLPIFLCFFLLLLLLLKFLCPSASDHAYGCVRLCASICCRSSRLHFSTCSGVVCCCLNIFFAALLFAFPIVFACDACTLCVCIFFSFFIIIFELTCWELQIFGESTNEEKDIKSALLWGEGERGRKKNELRVCVRLQTLC